MWCALLSKQKLRREFAYITLAIRTLSQLLWIYNGSKHAGMWRMSCRYAADGRGGEAPRVVKAEAYSTSEPCIFELLRNLTLAKVSCLTLEFVKAFDMFAHLSSNTSPSSLRTIISSPSPINKIYWFEGTQVFMTYGWIPMGFLINLIVIRAFWGAAKTSSVVLAPRLNRKNSVSKFLKDGLIFFVRPL